MAFAELLDRAGGVGLFQALQIFTLFFPSVLIPYLMLMENFSAAVPSHRCWVPLLDNSTAQAGVPAALGPKDLLTVSIPPGPNHEPHQCRRFRQPQWQLLDPNGTATNWSEAATEPCVDGWVYDHSTFTSTIVSEWDLVCDHKGLKSVSQTLYMTGLLIGSIFWGVLADQFGRKWILSWSCLQVALISTSTIFASNFYIYAGLRFLVASGVSGILLTSMMLLVEWTTTRRRATTITIQGCFYSLGQMTLGILAFIVRDWRTLQMAMSMPFFAIFLISWWLPESARWLIVVGKPEQGLRELHKVARINGHKEATKSLTIEVLMTSMKEEVASKKAHRSVLELFLVPILRNRSCIMFILCFSNVMSYYGLVLDLQNLGNDIFLLQVLFGVVDLLARVATPFLLSILGRRIILGGFQATAGLSILANALAPKDLQILRMVFAVLGRGCFGAIFTCLSVYKSELYPTALRKPELRAEGRAAPRQAPLTEDQGEWRGP
ncbi:solute carrier family 22 member 11-like isoform X3 [Suricata suricatta]|uniref:solute carrier family 22 member 11-like isoform X3 n=1 Tax=Suricata suricatta TaxID=37032 RepID=UPI001156B13F|nr:solute carrier family 22 member 11-like isoform X3 [Suricata suricatta]